MLKKFQIGCCGFPISQKEYYQRFNCIEINITFYQLPELKTAIKWKEEASKINPRFEFIIKAWQLITHPTGSFTYRRCKEKIPESKKKNYGFFKPTKEVFNAWKRTKEFAETLGCKKILFQCPATFKPTEENIKNIRTFFKKISKSKKDLIFIWEPRGEWKENQIKNLCQEFNLVHCVDPLAPILNEPYYGKFNYFRLHGTYWGTKIDYSHEFSNQELKRVLSACDKSLNYVMFNNSTMFEDALRFESMIK